MSTDFDNLVIRDLWLLSYVREPGEIIQTSVAEDASLIPLKIDPCVTQSYIMMQLCIPPNNWITFVHVMIIKLASYMWLLAVNGT